ncbi:MAG: hypothetical protein V3R66_03085 [Rhodospirillales bacterium]
MIRHTTILILLLAGALSLTLFTVKYHVQDLEQELTDLDRSIADDRQAIHVLKAEWSLLNDPERLRLLSTRYLGMKPVEVEQFGDFDDLPERPPKSPVNMPETTEEGTPTALQLNPINARASE